MFEVTAEVVGRGGGNLSGGDEFPPFGRTFPLFLFIPALLCLLLEELEPEQDMVEDDEWEASTELFECWFFDPIESFMSL